MKNIFLLPTDKPSKLFIDVDNNKLTITDKPIGGEHFMNQNLYITSDEEIKTGDYFKSGKYVWKMRYPKWGEEGQGEAKKVILTTDENLIKDNVQSIDDEFLKWFVKNPSCDFVNVVKDGLKVKEGGIQELMKDEYYQKFPEELPNCVFIDKYKIITPQKEWISPMRPFKVKENRSETMQRFIDNAQQNLDCPYGFTSRCTMGRCDCKPRHEGRVLSKEEVMQGRSSAYEFHSFCETPKEKCTMNYCDDNGCMNRKRELAEPKEILVKMMQDDEELGLYEEPNIIDKWLEENGNPEIANQVELEAEEMLLEEASEKRYPFGDGFQIMDIDISETLQLAFINGAKWQKERSYSEEELKDIVNKTVGNFCTLFSEDLKQKVAKEWFNQFKK